MGRKALYLVGVDVGSTSIKSVVFDSCGAVVSMAKKPTPLVSKKIEDLRTETFWDPLQIWRSVSSVLSESVSTLHRKNEIRGVAVTGFGSDGVPVDREGKCLYPFISWHDKKTVEQLKVLHREMGTAEVYSITGTKPWYLHTLLRLMWMKKHRPEIYFKTYKWLLITDYINFKLCGEMATDFSEASTTLVFDQNTSMWSEKILKKVGIEKSLFPDPLQSATVIGKVTEEASRETGLQAGTPVVLGGHDNICSFLASRDPTGDVPVSITGTWESILISTPAPVISKEGMEKNLVCEKSVITDEYILWGAHQACSMFEWFKNAFYQNEKTPVSDDSLFSAIAKSGEGTRGVFMLPHALGSISPDDDPQSRGVFVGVSEKTGREDFLKALIAGINYQCLSIIDVLEKARGRTHDRIINIGGAAYSAFWMQNRADVIGRTVEVPDIKEATAFGVAILAGIGTGVYNSYRDALKNRKSEIIRFHPDEKHHKRHAKYYTSIFSELYLSTKKINNRISELFS
jgi:xylulokinase